MSHCLSRKRSAVSNEDIGGGSDPGLCRDCRYSKRLESDRGSVFWRCELALEDLQFPKYPRLPVLVCRGYKSKGSTGS
jgi:hypothetical protein